jgi:predicted nucleic acid-binding protein
MSPEPKISKQDIENKIRVLQADISGRASDKKQSIIAIGSIALSVVVVLAYLFGRRSGRRRGSRVEFRRF